MELAAKIEILANSAKYDASCSSSGSRRKNEGSTGNCMLSGICHSWSDDGRCQSLLKILQSNDCIYDCAYCINRRSNDIERTTLEPRELADLTMEFYRRNYIEGLFLSSGVQRNPDYAMESMCKTLEILRKEHRFCGYIHVKCIPGADNKLITRAGNLADRISVNLELPSRQSLQLLAPQKKHENIVTPMKFLRGQIEENRYERNKSKKAPIFAPAGQTTQMIIGASPESDKDILTLSEALYQKMQLKRVYYSAYVPTTKSENLPAISAPPLWREHRLYQADWLIRVYGYQSEELFSTKDPNFSPELDPKVQYAIANLHLFPVEINKADYQLLLRIPGIGKISARRILQARRMGQIDFDHLVKLGVVLKRAVFFITCKGRYFGGIPIREDLLRVRLREENPFILQGKPQQVSMF